MNETNLTPRQRLISNLVSQSEGLSRAHIQERLSKTHKISKPTLIRDLNALVEKKLIRVEGDGRNTRYCPNVENPLLRFFDPGQYFAIEPDDRVTARTTFDPGVFDYLSGLFLKTEIEELDQIRRSFEKQTAKLSADILRRELERFVIELSWKSSRIEGNTYTLLQTEELIKERREAEGKSKEEALMILNHKSAFETIIENKKDFKILSLSKINQLHNVLVKGLGIGTGLRKQAVGITGTVYRPLDDESKIRGSVEQLFQIVSKNENPFEKALIISAMIPYIQPYSDGNKRVGRMLANAVLLAGDCYPLSYRSVNEEEFKKSLILFYEQNSIYHLKRLFVEQLVFAYNNYFK